MSQQSESPPGIQSGMARIHEALLSELQRVGIASLAELGDWTLLVTGGRSHSISFNVGGCRCEAWFSEPEIEHCADDMAGATLAYIRAVVERCKGCCGASDR